MNNVVAENQEFIILSPKVTNAAKCKIKEIFDDGSFLVELNTKEYYKNGDKVDLFSVIGSGVQYLTSVLRKTDNQLLTVEKPSKTVLIQRREYARVEIHKNILIPYNGKNIRAEILDISAGGMRLLSETEMQNNFDYDVSINIENNVNFSCKFLPIRIVFDEKMKKYSISGKFQLLKNIDKVALIQFCMKKQSELQNK